MWTAERTPGEGRNDGWVAGGRPLRAPWGFAAGVGLFGAPCGFAARVGLFGPHGDLQQTICRGDKLLASVSSRHVCGLSRSIRRVLGRLGTGSAVAALPLAGLLWAASGHGRVIVGAVSAVLLAVVLVVTFAPWIPYLRELRPGHRRLTKLEAFWVEGHELRIEPVESDPDLADWATRRADWHRRTFDWIAGNISSVEAQRFARPRAASYSWSDSYNTDHNAALNTLNHQLPELIRLRDEQRVLP
jgi:hypothetical protein